MTLLKHLDMPIPGRLSKCPNKPKSSRRCRVLYFRFVPFVHKTAEQLVRLSCLSPLCSGLLEQSIGVHVQVGVREVAEVFKVCTWDTVLQRRWASRSLAFRVVVEGWAVEVFKGFLRDRNQQLLCRSRWLTFHFRTVVSQVFSPRQGSSASSSSSRTAERVFDGFFSHISRVNKVRGPAASAKLTRQVIFLLPESSRTPARGRRRLMSSRESLAEEDVKPPSLGECRRPLVVHGAWRWFLRNDMDDTDIWWDEPV